ncbi:MAG: alcohol dehydrogenase catalytic domain-containing protein [Gammaproteobacteria bacterium]|nr:alcohol dehydrogenase catalytic domain-containing protein [Gammaproteobacteria bacterium]
MKAVILQNNADLVIDNIDSNEIKPDECMISIKSAGICASDVPRAFDNGAYSYPLIMGHELAGQIVKCGAEVDEDLREGMSVVIFPLLPCGNCISCKKKKYAQCSSYSYYGSRQHGGFAEYLNVKSWNILPYDDSISYNNASLTEPVSVVIHALNRASILNENYTGNVAIVGSGFLGLVAANILKMQNPEINITIFDRNDYKLQIASSIGVEDICLKDNTEWDDYLNANHSKFDVVIEASGVPSTYISKPGAKVVWMGNISDDLVINKGLVSSILRKELTIIGTWNSVYDGRNESDWLTALELMRKGFSPSKFVTHYVSLDEVPKIMQKQYNHKTRLETHDILKVIVNPKD